MTLIHTKACTRLEKIANWLQGPVGQLLLETEQDALTQTLEPFFGSFLIHYSLGATQPLKAPNIRCSLALSPRAVGGAVVCAEDAWPLEPNGADVVVVQHGLDFASNPHQVLREAALSVRAGGHLVIVGINPWSTWGMAHVWARDGLGHAHCLSARRVQDWLKLLGFALEKRHVGCYRPPLASTRWQSRLQPCESFGQRRQMPGAGFYMLVARKLMLGARAPRQAARQPLRVLLPAPAVKVSAQSVEKPRGN